MIRGIKIIRYNTINNEYKIENENHNNEIDYEETKNDTNNKFEDNILTSATKKVKSKKYEKRENLDFKILSRLAEGNDSCGSLSKKMNVRKQLVCYWRDRGLAVGIIVPSGGIRPAFYTRGPRYYLLNSPGWQSRKFGPIHCRIHTPRGDYYCYLIQSIGELHQVQVRAEDGSIYYEKLFPHLSSQKPFRQYPAIHLNIPYSIAQCDNATATIRPGSKKGNDVIYLSPPAVNLTVHEFDQIRNPFSLSLYYINYFLGHLAKWSIVPFNVPNSFHYAFSWDDVELYCPDLLQGIPHLSRGSKPENVVLYWDESLGKGIRDYETTSKGIASDIFALLEVNRKQIIGKRKAKYQKSKKMPRSNQGLRKFPMKLAVDNYLGIGPED